MNDDFLAKSDTNDEARATDDEMAKPIAESSQNVPKEDPISRKAAIDALRAMQTYKLGAGDDMLLIDQAEAQTELMMLPPAQPEIIRCKDCKHYYYADNRIPQEQRYSCNLDGDRWTPDSFCSFAERREE